MTSLLLLCNHLRISAAVHELCSHRFLPNLLHASSCAAVGSISAAVTAATARADEPALRTEAAPAAASAPRAAAVSAPAA